MGAALCNHFLCLMAGDWSGDPSARAGSSLQGLLCGFLEHIALAEKQRVLLNFNSMGHFVGANFVTFFSKAT